MNDELMNHREALIKRIDEWTDEILPDDLVEILQDCRAALLRSSEDKHTRYVPMTDDDHLFYLNSDASNIQMMIDHERAVLARLPKPDTAERDAEIQAKLSERKTVHLWLNDLGVPKHEATGKPMCLLRRLSVALNVQPHDADHVPASPEVEARVDAAVEAGRINDKRDAEREALVRRIDEATQSTNRFCELFRDIRAHLVGGGE